MHASTVLRELSNTTGASFCDKCTNSFGAGYDSKKGRLRRVEGFLHGHGWEGVR